MKKTFMALAFAGMVSMASAEGYFGLYTLGAQYTVDNGNFASRFGVGVPLALGGALIVTGNAAIILPGGNLSNDGAWKSRYGFGTDLGFISAGGAGALLVRPNILGVVEYNFQNGVSLFGEANIGPAFVTGSGGGGLIGYAIPGFKLGVNFR
ncbi:hypothetical protein [Deinococcus peraridilitoris]|uniref:Outer membrane protein beta-barrel domain-containing protein n=1 Tax=Deinococcus peraridilitoris (strain DSM 19664 / LMG 22246 / CIP 109416 / KR-200) TaxID=937777 RepID=L0A633_DEIPD|nr:hypothetical protein [Deinococcus peraridilitoris]AFZ68914.1 hypothetical protein Deipe_3481 [Deinococcus peraridilitoris DSM 19664]